VRASRGIALINSVANLGGLLGPTILGEFVCGQWPVFLPLAVAWRFACGVR